MVFVNIEIIFFRMIYDNMKKLIRIHSLKKEDELKLEKEYSKYSKVNNMLYELHRIWDLFFDTN